MARKVMTIDWHSNSGHDQEWIRAAAKGGVVIQLKCGRCGLLVGQVDRGEFLAIEDHEAPCGLPCAAWDPAKIPMSGIHVSDAECARCRPQKCPVCKGRGVAVPPGEELSNTCERCKGSGLVAGSELFED